MDINQKYIDWYMKRTPCLHLPFKLVNDRQIDMVFEKLVENGSALSRKSPCLFNAYSLTNIIRDYEAGKAFVDESEKATAPFEDLKAGLFKLHYVCVKNCPAIVENISTAQSVFAAEYPNADNSVFGLIGFSFIFDTGEHSAEWYGKLLSRKANTLNYNVVDFNVQSKNKNVVFNGKAYVLSKFDIQFEATYQDKVDLRIGRYVYHVTTKNAAAKILKTGLLPGNKNAHGFKYPNRSYVFIDLGYVENLAVPYAVRSKKVNKRFFTKAELKKLAGAYVELHKKVCGSVVNTREFTILQIDLEKTKDIKLYRDNTFEIGGNFVAAYTENPVRPTAITAICDFTIPKDA